MAHSKGLAVCVVVFSGLEWCNYLMLWVVVFVNLFMMFSGGKITPVVIFGFREIFGTGGPLDKVQLVIFWG